MPTIKRDQYEAKRSIGLDSVCLIFLFPADESLTAYAKTLPPHANVRKYPSTSDPSLMAIGCVWSSWKCGKTFVLFEASVATSDMSRLFSQSTSISATFTHIAQRAGALVAILDEDCERTQIWPGTRRRLPAVDEDQFRQEDLNLDVDAYCSSLLAAADIKAQNKN